MTVDLTGIAVAAIGVVGSLLGIWLTYIIQLRVKQPQMAAQLQNAMMNALGAIQQATDAQVRKSALLHPTVPIGLAPGVEYVAVHAPEAIAYFGRISDDALASKLDAKIGLASIAAGTPSKSTITPDIPPTAIPAAVPAVAPPPLAPQS